MGHKTAITSRQSYLELQPRIGRVKRIIYEFVKAHPGCNNNDIERGTGLRINVVSGRVNELVNEDRLLKTAGRKRDPVTKSNTYTWELRSEL